jgi:hypothetical protein
MTLIKLNPALWHFSGVGSYDILNNGVLSKIDRGDDYEERLHRNFRLFAPGDPGSA